MADTLNVTGMAVTERLHNLGLVQKAGNWFKKRGIGYHMKAKDNLKSKDRFASCCLNDAKGSHFLYGIVTKIMGTAR